MSTLILNPKITDVFRLLPEIWYVILLALYLWDRHLSILFCVSAICLVLLIKQIFRKNGWISLILGFTFSFVSFWMIGASLSEYHEFPTERESEATRFIILWITVFGTSLILAIRMFYIGIRRIYSS